MVMSDAWGRYIQWNSAIADIVFPITDQPLPVYLDLEETKLEMLATALGVPADEFPRELSTTVNAILRQDVSHRDLFIRVRSELRAWRRDLGEAASDELPEPPPVLPVLSLLSLTAERMHRDSRMADHNFYGRLNELLGRPLDDRLVVDSYRRDGERFWLALNDWLDLNGGLRGVPTAHALGHRHIGLPLSQALLRSSDRAKLGAFFARYGLAPGSQLPPTELRPLLDQWLSSSQATVSNVLRSAWGTERAKDAITEGVASALASWDGSTRGVETGGQEGGSRSKVALVLDAGGFPKKRFRLGIVLYASDPAIGRDGTILTGDEEVHVRLTPGPTGGLSVGHDATFDPGSLLEGSFRLRDSHTAAVSLRLPKRLTVFLQDPLSMRWVEADQVMLGDKARVLVQETISSDVEDTLSLVARPGWTRLELPQIPPGWLLYDNVEIFAHAPGLDGRMTDLGPLAPRTTQQFQLTGGFRLPGATRATFHRSAPPDVRAVTDSPDGATVTVTLEGRDETGAAVDVAVFSGSTSEGVLVEPLAPLGLEEGSYRLDIADAKSARRLSSTRFALRDGDHPDVWSWQKLEPVSYDLTHPLGVLGVPGGGGGDLDVKGAQGPKQPGELRSAEVPVDPWWEKAPRTTPAQLELLRIARPDPDSCVYTGRHVEELPLVELDRRGRPVQQYVEGRCKGCGLVRRYTTNYYRNRRKWDRRAHGDHNNASIEQQATRIAAIPPIDNDQLENWDLMLDGLFFTGGGRWAQFERLTSFVEPTALFTDQAARSLESLAHVDIRRDPRNLKMIGWEVSPSTLVPNTNGFYMAGYWPNGLSDSLMEAGDGAEWLENELGPSSWFANTVPQEWGEYVEVNAALRLLTKLPTLSQVMAALPRTDADHAARAEWFDVRGARWVPVENLQQQGGYRLSRFTKVDAVRTPSDLESGTQALSTVQLSKHIAAYLAGTQPLLSYDADSGTLVVPRGADLPGLYGRAVVLNSGRAPLVDGRRLVYLDVPPAVASHLAYLFSN